MCAPCLSLHYFYCNRIKFNLFFINYCTSWHFISRHTEIHSQNGSDEKIGQLLVIANQLRERWALTGEKNICIDRSRCLIVIRFLFTSCDESQTNEWAQRTSDFAILHNSWINIVRTHRPWSNLYFRNCIHYTKESLTLPSKQIELFLNPFLSFFLLLLLLCFFWPESASRPHKTSEFTHSSATY